MYSANARSTTVLGLIHKDRVVIASDGQVTFGDTVLKTKANKIRKLHNDTVLAGFAGSAADAFSLFERFEEKLEKFNGNLSRAAVDMAKDWRMDRYLRRLEAHLAVLNKQHIYLISGTGDLIEPDDQIIAIGSGGPYALAAARALKKHSKLDAVQIVKEAMSIASSLCIYTNSYFSIETLN
ncbi:ATP-dependent protease subunit HslV [candidate division KSB1 bacterium]|nr:ATP-dependent protease subunit HslV [candidate division KSB1 bacterium]